MESDIWSVPGINPLNREGTDCERWNRRHPDEEPRIPYLTKIMEGHKGPAVFSSDSIRAYPEQIRRLIPNPLTTLGTDGFGRSDSRERLRAFFEIDRFHIVLSALEGLAESGEIDKKIVKEAITRYGLDADKANPMMV